MGELGTRHQVVFRALFNLSEEACEGSRRVVDLTESFPLAFGLFQGCPWLSALFTFDVCGRIRAIAMRAGNLRSGGIYFLGARSRYGELRPSLCSGCKTSPQVMVGVVASRSRGSTYLAINSAFRLLRSMEERDQVGGERWYERLAETLINATTSR